MDWRWFGKLAPRSSRFSPPSSSCCWSGGFRTTGARSSSGKGSGPISCSTLCSRATSWRW